MPTATPAIAILGAGPSGLMLARLLEVKQIDYVVFERDESATAVGQGGTLDIHTGSGQTALQQAGLFDKFKSLARYDGQAFKVVDKDGNGVLNMTPDGRDDRPEIDRKELRQLLLNSVPAEKIRWKHRVESVYRSQSGSMAVRFDDGRVEEGFKLVVGADGAWSKARSLITPAKPQYSGISYLQTSISTSNPNYSRVSQQCGTGMYMVISDAKSIIVQRMGNGSYNVYVSLHLPENWAKQEAQLFKSPDFRTHVMAQYFADWSTHVTDLVKHSDGDFHSWPLYALPPDTLSWESVPGITLLGDAAHLALSNGEGVNCGMYDSLQLAEEIETCGMVNLDEAVKRYEEKMLPRGVAHIEDGNQMQAMFHAQDSVVQFKAWAQSMGA